MIRFISKITEYAIRALIVLSKESAWRIHVKTICEIDDLPVHFTRKALQTLARVKIIEGSRGPGGGYLLKKHPNKIKLIDIVKLFDSIEPQKKCLLGEYHCTTKEPCNLRRLSLTTNKKLIFELKNLTIADLAGIN